MLRLPVNVVFCALFIIDLVAAGTSFTNPIGANDGTTYDLGQQINISWQGAENFTALSLGLRQSATTNIYWIIGSPGGPPSGYTASSYLWSIAFGNGESLAKGNEFSFWLVDGGYDIQIYSSTFYLRDPTASSSTTSSSTTSISSTTSSSAPTTSSQSSSTPISTATSAAGATSSPSSPADVSADSSSGFSTGAKVGVAVGIVAAFALGLGLAYFLFRRRERSKMTAATVQSVPAFGQNSEMKPYEPGNTDPYSYHGQRELPGDQPQPGGQYPYQAAHEVL